MTSTTVCQCGHDRMVHFDGPCKQRGWSGNLICLCKGFTVHTSTTDKVELDKESIESIAEPWICCEEKPCEEAVAVHWDEMITALTAALTRATHVQSVDARAVACEIENWIALTHKGEFPSTESRMALRDAFEAIITKHTHVQSPSEGVRAAAEEIAELYVDDPTTIDREVLAKHMGNIEAIIAKHVQPVFVTCDYRKPECVNEGALVDGVWQCNNHLGRVSDTLSDGGRAVANPEHGSNKSLASGAPYGPSVTECIEAVEDVLDQWNGDYEHYALSGAPTGNAHMEQVRQFASEVTKALESLQGKAPETILSIPEAGLAIISVDNNTVICSRCKAVFKADSHGWINASHTCEGKAPVGESGSR